MTVSFISFMPSLASFAGRSICTVYYISKHTPLLPYTDHFSLIQNVFWKQSLGLQRQSFVLQMAVGHEYPLCLFVKTHPSNSRDGIRLPTQAKAVSRAAYYTMADRVLTQPGPPKNKKPETPQHGVSGNKKAANQNRTGDLILTKDAHYRLCYSSLYWGLTRNEEIIS